MNRKLFTVFSALFFLLALLFVCTGCAENGAQDSDDVAYVDLSQGFSRGIESVNETQIPVDSLYWTYKATKVRGNYTTGQTQTEKAVVKNGPATGLGTVGPFSVGVWHFEIFGYRSCTENASGELEFTDQVYKCCDRNHGASGTTPEHWIEVTIDKRTDPSAQALEVLFELENVSTETYGTLAFSDVAGSFTLTVPEGQKIFGTKHPLNVDGSDFKDGAEIVVKVWAEKDATDVTPAAAVPPATVGSNLIATSKTLVTTDKKPGEVITLNAFGFVLDGDVPRNKFKGANTQDSFNGIHNLYFAVEYMDKYTYMRKDSEYKWSTKTDGTQNIYDDGYAPVGEIAVYPLAFKANVRTTISGDVNDIRVGDEPETDIKVSAYIAKITTDAGTTDYYTSLTDAYDAVSTAANPIVLLRDVDDGETVPTGKSVWINPDGFVLKNLEIAGTGKATIIPEGCGQYEFSGDGGKLNDFHYLKEYITVSSVNYNFVEYDTSGVMLTVSNGDKDSIWHTGSAEKVTVSGKVAKFPSPSDSTGVVYVEYVDEVKACDLGYHIWANINDTFSIGSYGYFDIGESISINKLGGGFICDNEFDIVLHGRRTSVVGNLNNIRDLVGADDLAMGDNQKRAFGGFRVVLKGCGGKSTVYSSGSYVDGNDIMLFGIDGMYLELPTFKGTRTVNGYYKNTHDRLFSKQAEGNTVELALINWNTRENPVSATPGVSYSDGGKILVGTDPENGSRSKKINLYAQWSQPVGGKIYYVDSYNGGNYSFFNADGSPMPVAVASAPTLTEVKDAKSYTVRNKPENAADMFYVCNKSMVFTTDIMWGYDGSASEILDGFEVYPNNSVINYGFGGGRKVWNAVKARGGKYIDGTRKCIWVNISKINSGDTISGFTNTTSCKDWFLPNACELLAIVKSTNGLSWADYGITSSSSKVIESASLYTDGSVISLRSSDDAIVLCGRDSYGANYYYCLIRAF